MPGAPLSLAPAAIAAAWNASTAARSFGEDRHVHRLGEPALAADPEIRLAVPAEARGRSVVLVLLHLHDQGVAERRQRLQIEILGAGVVGNGEADVIDHEKSPDSRV